MFMSTHAPKCKPVIIRLLHISATSGSILRQELKKTICSAFLLTPSSMSSDPSASAAAFESSSATGVRCCTHVPKTSKKRTLIRSPLMRLTGGYLVAIAAVVQLDSVRRYLNASSAHSLFAALIHVLAAVTAAQTACQLLWVLAIESSPEAY